ncbi:prepilin peptidase [Affinibrenneria salicis]|uniref:Prepilin peptidase n=1 Tax=Affinibrenneria salicis TaxID=2590031 RepID=A0A5J5FXX2_9GAMM|nr:A24 family peptidase [Affinibrenneria salicis]KAA8998956.1 prepilin peptidase [Affinibrenneria salicis]
MMSFILFSAQFPALWLTAVAAFGLIAGLGLSEVACRLSTRLERQRRQEACRPPLAGGEACVRQADIVFCAQRGAAAQTRAQAETGRRHPPSQSEAVTFLHPVTSCHLLLAALGMALFLAAAWHRPPGVALLGSWILLSFLLLLAVVDARTMLLPDILTVPLLWIGLSFNLVGAFVPLGQAVSGAMAGYLAFWGLLRGARLLTGRDGLGYGDAKLLAALGAWLGWQALPLLVLIAASAGIGAALLGRGRRVFGGQARPFGPWLALGGALSLLAR